MFRVAGGSGRVLGVSGVEFQGVRFFPSGDRLQTLPNDPGQPLRLYVQTIGTGKAQPLTSPLMIRNTAISPDGERVAVLPPDRKLAIYPVSGGPPHIFPARESFAPLRWRRDRDWLYVQHLRSSVR